MKHLNPFFTIGTIGLIVTATLHIFMAFLLNKVINHITFISIYPMFTVFLLIGTKQILKKDKLKIILLKK